VLGQVVVLYLTSCRPAIIVGVAVSTQGNLLGFPVVDAHPG